MEPGRIRRSHGGHIVVEPAEQVLDDVIRRDDIILERQHIVSGHFTRQPVVNAGGGDPHGVERRTIVARRVGESGLRDGFRSIPDVSVIAQADPAADAASEPRVLTGVEEPEFHLRVGPGLLFQELLEMRESSPLFHLQTEESIQGRVVFHNTGPDQLPGLIVMSIDDGDTAVDLDRYNEMIIVLVNANDEAQSFTQAGLAGLDLQLHDIQANSVDPIVTTSTFDAVSGTFVIPGRTTAVFVLEETPENLILMLKADVQTLIDNGDLAPQDANVLFTKLANALNALERNQPAQAIKHLQQFIKQVEKLVRQSKLSLEHGQALIYEAEIIIDRID